MTRPPSELQDALALRVRGLTVTSIARRLGIPRSTINDWVSGRVPGASRDPDRCVICGHLPHTYKALPSPYVYLLGLYLGDGCISRHPRTYRLRLALDAAYPTIIADASAAMKAATRQFPRALLRGLIHSDGCRFINTGSGGWRHPRYSFTNLSDDIRRIFTEACDLVGVRWTAARTKIYVSRKADVATLDSFIGPKA